MASNHLGHAFSDDLLQGIVWLRLSQGQKAVGNSRSQEAEVGLEIPLTHDGHLAKVIRKRKLRLGCVEEPLKVVKGVEDAWA
jgi:hypothetical protein